MGPDEENARLYLEDGTPVAVPEECPSLEPTEKGWRQPPVGWTTTVSAVMDGRRRGDHPPAHRLVQQERRQVMERRTKFTPGPWSVTDGYHIVDGDGYMVASTSQREHGEELANAVAIAALPDLCDCLLEACAEMCHNLSEDTGYCRYLDREAMLCRQLDGECFVQKWLKALAKARGEVRE